MLTEQNGPILRYQVLYREADGDNVTKSVSGLSVVLQGLKPYTTSFIQVAAVNSNGTGPYSDIEEATTFSDRKFECWNVPRHVDVCTYVYQYMLWTMLCGYLNMESITSLCHGRWVDQRKKNGS